MDVQFHDFSARACFHDKREACATGHDLRCYWGAVTIDRICHYWRIWLT